MGAETKQSRPQRVTRVLCAAEPRGSADAIDALVRAAGDLDVQAIALVGDLTSGGGDARGDYRGVFRTLGRAGLPAFWVPGPADAPVEHYLREAHNSEIVHPFLRGVHGSVAFASGSVLVAGFGGEVDDDPEGARDERQRLRYPRWEAEYRLKALAREFSEYPELILLFATPPAHKGLGVEGSEALAELAATYRARLVVCAGSPGTMMIGRTLVVAPGPLADGACAVADLHARTVERAYARSDRAAGPRVRA
jgi:uncharacterized protein